MRRSTILTLAYHKVGVPEDGPPTWYYVSTDTFAAHMRILAESRWEVVSVAALAAALDEAGPLPPFAALVTFDDGYQHLRRTAVPILVDYGFPSAMFVPTAFIGGWNTFDQCLEPREAIVTWKDLECLRDVGVSIESHAVSHRRLSELSPDDQLTELVESRRVLEDWLGTTVRSFAYPYGDSGKAYDATRDLVRRAGYALAFGYGGGPAPVDAMDRFAIERVAVGSSTEIASVLDHVVSR